LSTSRSIASSIGSLKLDEFLYYAAFACCALAGDLQLTSLVRSGYVWVQSFVFLLQISACLLLAFKLFAFQRYTTKQLVFVAVLSLVALLSYYFSRDSLVMLSILFVIAGKGVSLKNLAKIEFVVTICILIIAFVGDATGILESIVMDGRDGVRGIRRSMGFDHPNSLGIALVKICVAAFAIGGSEGLSVGLILSAFSAVMTIVASDSRTALIGLGLLVLLFVVRKAVLNRHLGASIFLGTIIGLAGFSILMSLYFTVYYSASNPTHAYLNELLTGRLKLASWYYGLYPPSLFGQDVSVFPLIYMYGGAKTSHFVVDNAISHLLIQYGYVPCGLMLLGALLLFRKAWKERCICTLVIAFAFAAIHGFSEYYFIRFDFNYFMLAFSYVLYDVPLSEPKCELFLNEIVNISPGPNLSFSAIPHLGLLQKSADNSSRYFIGRDA